MEVSVDQMKFRPRALRVLSVVELEEIDQYVSQRVREMERSLREVTVTTSGT